MPKGKKYIKVALNSRAIKMTIYSSKWRIIVESG